MMNKKGDLTGVLYLIVMISAFAIFLIIVGYIGSEINTQIKDQINDTDDRINTVLDRGINVSQNTLSAVWYVMFGGLLIGLLITAWHMPTNPVFIPIFIFLLVVAIIVGVAMSNAYEALYNITDFASIAPTQVSINFIMSNLPYVALIIGIIGIIVTFAKPKGEDVAMM